MSDPSVTPALAAHREALARLIAPKSWTNRELSEEHTGTIRWSLARADAVLAYFADPAHGLTVETGAVECEDCESAGRNCLIHRRHPDDASPAHGLVRDEPSEDDLLERDRSSSSVQVDEPSEDERAWREELHGYVIDGDTSSALDLVERLVGAPARSDDGRTAIELTVDEQAQISDALSGAIWTGTGSGAAVRATVRNILAARLRHDDGEADRGDR